MGEVQHGESGEIWRDRRSGVGILRRGVPTRQRPSFYRHGPAGARPHRGSHRWRICVTSALDALARCRPQLRAAAGRRRRETPPPAATSMDPAREQSLVTGDRMSRFIARLPSRSPSSRRSRSRVRAADQAGRAQQLQDVPGLPRALQEGHGARASTRSTPPAACSAGRIEIVSRDDNGTPGDAVRVAEELLSREKVVLLMGTFASNVGLAVADFAKQRKVLFLAAEPLTDKIVWENGNRVHVPAARVDVHADGDARPRGRQARQEALGDRLSELRVRPVGDRGVQEADDRAAAGRASSSSSSAVPLGKIDAGPVVQALLDAQARRDLLVAVRARPRALRPRRASCAACSRTGRCSTCWAASPNTSIR